MSKKGLIASLVIGCLVTLSLGIYTLVSVFGVNLAAPQGPENTTINVAFRTADKVNQLSGYSAESMSFTVPEGEENPIKLNEETGVYEAVSAGKVTVVVVLDEKGNTKTFEITVYAQGDGSKDAPFIIASADHLVEFANMVNSTSAERVVPENVKLVSDIDLGELNWKPIGGQGNNEYTGVFDGNGCTIKNLNISVNANNYTEFLAVSVSTEKRAFLDLGLFGKVNNAKILNLNIENANINVSNEIYNIITNEVKPEGAEFDKVVRLTIGTIAGSAYNTDILGGEAKAAVVSRINAFSCSNTSQAHGLGGIVGVAQLVRVNNYNVKTNIINNTEDVKGSFIGGVFGSSYSSYNAAYDNTYDAAHKTIIDNVNVDFASTLSYKNAAYVGGIIGLGNNTGVVNSKVATFKVVDNTARKFVDYTVKNPTLVAGAVAVLRSNAVAEDTANAFVSNMENVVVNNVDVFMLGGDVAGVIGIAGRSYSDVVGLKESLVVKNSTVSGYIVSNTAAGFVWQVNPGATISYTKTFEAPVVDVKIEAHMSAGFAFVNNGVITGYQGEVEVPSTEEGVEPTTKLVKTEIKVEVVGMGALIENATPENISLARTATYAAGFASNIETEEALIGQYEAKVSNFDIKFTAKKSINYAGVTFTSTNATIENLSVNADVESYNYSKQENNISTTYMVAGVVCEAGVGTNVNNVNVIINANQNVENKELNYGATFFGGIVARYAGDVDSLGLRIENCEVSGNVYFNHSYENVMIGETEYNVFIAGGLIGAIESKVGAGEYVDAFGIASIENTASSIISNKVKGLKIIADFVSEVNGNEAYRVKGIGALLGVLNAAFDAPVLDLSSNTIENVEIVADDTTFTYAYTIEGGSVVENITLGANKLNSYGASYSWNSGYANKITNPQDLSGITYTSLEK